MNLPLTPIRCLYRGVDLYGHKEGVVCGEHRYTYAEFGERCERLAAGLRSLGVSPGDRVAFLSFNTHKLLEGYYGPPLIRAVFLPLNARLTSFELSAILNHAEPRVLIIENEFAPLAEAFRRQCPAIRGYINTSDGYEELLSGGRLARPDLRSFDENEIAELFYTSGSTGPPKGVMLSHRTLYLHALGVSASFHVTDQTVCLHTIPLFHANGWGRPQTAVMNGSKQVLVRSFEAETVLRLIETEKVTTLPLVPTMANILLNCRNLGQFDTSSLREVIVGGSPSSPSLISRLEQTFHCRVNAGYGLTETCPEVSSGRHKETVRYADEADRFNRMARAGWPILGTEVRVVDGSAQDVPRDMVSVGEVVIRGDNVMDGYYKDPDGTKAVLEDDWLRTGDLAVWDQENYIQIVDRKKDIIISGGENISSIELEKAIFAHPAVLECAVVAAPDPKWGEIPAAIVVLKQDALLSRGELLEFLKPTIAKFKLPGLVRFDSALPKTGSGKIQKQRLRELFRPPPERSPSS